MKMKRYSMAKVKIGEKTIKKPYMKKDPKGSWVKFEDMMDDLRGLANVMVEFGEETLGLIGEEEDDNSQ